MLKFIYDVDKYSYIREWEEMIMASPNKTHGPIVKTGPTANKNRSRNKDGRWRKKRSDAGLSREIWNILKKIDF